MTTVGKFQARDEAGKLIAWANGRGGIMNFLDDCADGTPNAQYELLSESKDEAGNTIFLIRSVDETAS